MCFYGNPNCAYAGDDSHECRVSRDAAPPPPAVKHGPERVADALILTHVAPLHARTLAEHVLSPLTDMLVDKLTWYRIDSEIQRKGRQDDADECRRIAQRAGVETMRRYPGAGPYHGDAFDGELMPSAMLADAVRQLAQARADLAASEQARAELLDALRLAQEAKGHAHGRAA